MSFSVQCVSEPKQRGAFTVGKLYRTHTPKGIYVQYIYDDDGIPRPVWDIRKVKLLEGWEHRDTLSPDELVQLGYITPEQLRFNNRMEALGQPGANPNPPDDDSYAFVRLLFPEHRTHDIDAALSWYAVGKFDRGVLCSCGVVLRAKEREFLAAREGVNAQHPSWRGLDIESPEFNRRMAHTGRVDIEADLAKYGFGPEER